MAGDPILIELVHFAATWGRAPTAAEVADIANFRQRGGVTRLCTALSKIAESYVSAPARKARS